MAAVDSASLQRAGRGGAAGFVACRAPRRSRRRERASTARTTGSAATSLLRAARLGASALFVERRRAARRDADTIQRSPVHSVQPLGQVGASSRAPPGASSKSMRPGSKRTRRTSARAQFQLDVALRAGERDERRRSAAGMAHGRRRLRRGAASAGRAGRSLERAGSATLATGAGPAAYRPRPCRSGPPPSLRSPRLAVSATSGRRQIGGVGEAHQHHIGRREGRCACRSSSRALDQNLPGAGQRRQRRLAAAPPRGGSPPGVSARRSARRGASFRRVTRWANSASSRSTCAGSAPLLYGFETAPSLGTGRP